MDRSSAIPGAAVAVPLLEFTVTAERVDAHGSVVRCKAATVTLDTDLAGRTDAFNPAELLLAALSACIIKGIERVAPILRFPDARRDGARARNPAQCAAEARAD